MSGNLFEIQAFAQSLIVGMGLTVLVLIVVTLVYWFIIGILLWRKEKVRSKERTFKEVNRVQIENLRMKSIKEEQEDSRNEILIRIKDIEEDEKKELEIYEKKIEKYDKRIKVVDYARIIQYMSVIILVVIIYMFLCVSFCRGCSISNLRKLDYDEQGV